MKRMSRWECFTCWTFFNTYKKTCQAWVKSSLKRVCEGEQEAKQIRLSIINTF